MAFYQPSSSLLQADNSGSSGGGFTGPQDEALKIVTIIGASLSVASCSVVLLLVVASTL